MGMASGSWIVQEKNAAFQRHSSFSEDWIAISIAVPIPKDAVESGGGSQKIVLADKGIGDAHVAPKDSDGIVGVALPNKEPFFGSAAGGWLIGSDIGLGEEGVPANPMQKRAAVCVDGRGRVIGHVHQEVPVDFGRNGDRLLG